MWTHFWDMHSGGDLKLYRIDGKICEDTLRDHAIGIGHLYIEAPEAEARIIFYNRFGRNPDRVTCTCCGEDYSVIESETLEEATGYQRKYSGVSLEDYCKLPEVEIVWAKGIKPAERLGNVPKQGYVWKD